MIPSNSPCDPTLDPTAGTTPADALNALNVLPTLPQGFEVVEALDEPGDPEPAYRFIAIQNPEAVSGLACRVDRGPEGLTVSGWRDTSDPFEHWDADLGTFPTMALALDAVCGLLNAPQGPYADLAA